MQRQHEQLATSENLTTLSILTASFSKIRQIRETSFTSGVPPLSKIISVKQPILNFKHGLQTLV
jgi:hypothetical protein